MPFILRRSPSSIEFATTFKSRNDVVIYEQHLQFRVLFYGEGKRIKHPLLNILSLRARGIALVQELHANCIQYLCRGIGSTTTQLN